METTRVAINKPTFKEALKVWIKVAIYSFGGPAGQIAVMHKLLVEDKRWISENRFLHALNYCMLLPGPEAQQLAIYIGWLLHKTKGGLIAGGLFVLPGFLSILILSILYALFMDITFVQGIFFGIKPAVLAIVIGAVIKIGKRALKNNVMVLMAVAAFVAIFFFQVDFPIIVLTAGLIGLIGGRVWEEKFYVIKGHQLSAQEETAVIDSHIQPEKPSTRRTIKVIMLHVFLWFIPILFIFFFMGENNIFFSEAIFFSKTAVVTFGGAYAVLAYITQKAVETYGWLRPGEMLDGLGMAETTPGPLIQVVQFVGFMGAFRFPGNLDPLTAAILASILVTWVTFVPCFLFIFAGAPYIEYLKGNKHLNTILSGITAAVVGVILNLGVWFTLRTLFQQIEEHQVMSMTLQVPQWESINVAALVITLIAFFCYFKLRLDMLKTIAVCILLGLAYYLLFR